MSYSNQNVKQDPGQFETNCKGFIDFVNNNYNKNDKSLTKNQFCKQNIKTFCASATISLDNCDDFFKDNIDHQPDSMAAYCDCKKKFTNPQDILTCCMKVTDDKYDCQDDVQNNTPCGDVIDGYQPYCDCRQQIAKNDPDIYKYGNDIISCCIQKSNNPGDCQLYVESKRDCPGIIPDTPPSQPDAPPSQPDTPPSQPGQGGQPVPGYNQGDIGRKCFANTKPQCNINGIGISDDVINCINTSCKKIFKNAIDQGTCESNEFITIDHNCDGQGGGGGGGGGSAPGPKNPSQPSSRKVGSQDNNLLSSLSLSEKIGFFILLIVICILIYFIIELSSKKK